MDTQFQEAERLRAVPFSDIRKVAERAAAIEQSGTKVIHLEIGRPDFDTPTHIKQAAAQALHDGFVHYTSNYGMPPLRQAIAAKLARENGLKVDPETELIVTTGASEAIAIAILGFLNPGDSLLIPNPAWLNYRHCASMAEAETLSYTLRAANQFQPDPDEIASLIRPGTKMLVLNTPHNPTGGVVRREVMEALAELAVKHNLLVIADEIYERIIYGDAEHISIAGLPGMRERTITVNGFSKAYAMDGWRLGYLAAPNNLVQSMVRVRQYLTTTPTSFAQAGAVAAYNGPQDCVEEMRLEYERRRQHLVTELNDIPSLSCVWPGGAFYAFPSIAALGMSSREASNYFLEEAAVATVPGTAFGSEGEGFIRLSYASAFDDIVIACQRLREAVARRQAR